MHRNAPEQELSSTPSPPFGGCRIRASGINVQGGPNIKTQRWTTPNLCLGFSPWDRFGSPKHQFGRVREPKTSIWEPKASIWRVPRNIKKPIPNINLEGSNGDLGILCWDPSCTLIPEVLRLIDSFREIVDSIFFLPFCYLGGC